MPSDALSNPSSAGAPATCDRRAFLTLACTATAAGALATPIAPAQDPAGGARRGPPARPRPAPPPNSLPPAIQFQAAPGGSGVLLGSGSAIDDRSRRLEIAPWVGPRPDSTEAIAFLPVHRLAALIRQRLLSPVELTDIYLERLKRLDPTLLFVVTLLEETARREAETAAREIAEGAYRGPLHGIPYGIKDLFAAKGAPTTWGAKPFADRVIDEDSEIVVRLREAGAILVAKLSLGTFARGDLWFRGRTRNPWNPEQGSSGSSAGPASATAAGCVGFAIGTETRGSIVSPARRCGISALRPTFGRVSRHGGMTLSWSMDKAGPLCRTVEDCALVFASIHGADPKDPSTVTVPFSFEREPDLGKIRIGYTSDADETFLDKLRELGADPKPIDDRPDSRDVGNILGAESAAAFDDFLAAGLDEKMEHPDRVAGFRRASEVSAVDYLHAQRRRLALMREMATFMEDLDLYVSRRGDIGLTNLTGHPAVVVPYRIDRGQPQCIQLIGNLFADDVALSVAHAYQNATEWHLEHPRV